MRYLPCCVITILTIATQLASLPVAAQKVATQSFRADTSVYFPALGAIAGVTKDDAETVRFLVVPPASARDQSVRDVDVRDGDIILMAAGKRIRSIDDLRAVHEETSPGELLKLGLQRGERRFIVSFPRGESQQQSGVHVSGGGGTMIMSINGDEGVELIPELGVVLSEAEGTVTVSATLPLPGGMKTQLQEGDQIAAVNGREPVSLVELMEIYGKASTGDSLKLGVDRNGEWIDLDLVKPEPVAGARMIRRGQ